MPEFSADKSLFSRPKVFSNYLLKKMLALVFLCQWCFFPSTATAWQSLPEKALVIENISLIDGTNPSVQPNKTIVIMGNRIKAIGEKGKISIPAKAIIVSGKGKYLIPGLWDSHVHLNAGKIFLPLFVANGVTTVKEMGGDLQEIKRMREEIAGGRLLGPRIKMAGTFLESARWMNWVIGLAKKDGNAEFLENLSKRIGVGNSEQAREAVKKLAAQGVDLIKVRNSETPETFLAILSEAKKYGLPVAAHAPRMDLVTASGGGLGSVEHADTVALAMYERSVKEVAQAFAQNGTWYAPTLIVLKNWRLTPKKTVLDLINDADGKLDERNLYVPDAVRQKWNRQIEEQKNEGSYDWAAQARKGINELRQMHKEGAGILAATDFGAILTYPGFSLHDELEALVEEGGLTPFEALQSATKNPPYFFNMQNEIGTIEAGKLADLVLLTANPLENISNTKKIDSVILNGKYLSQPNLEILTEVVKEQIQEENKKLTNK